MNCVDLLPISRERIFEGLEYDSVTKKIYKPCDILPVGIVKNGKIFWIKNR